MQASQQGRKDKSYYYWAQKPTHEAPAPREAPKQIRCDDFFSAFFSPLDVQDMSVNKIVCGYMCVQQNDMTGLKKKEIFHRRKNFFLIYEVFVKQKKRNALLITTHVCEVYTQI